MCPTRMLSRCKPTCLITVTLGSSQARQLGRHLEDICTRQTRVFAARCSGATDDLCHLAVCALDQAAAARGLAPWHTVVEHAVVTKWQAQNVEALRAAYLHKLLALYHDRQSILSKVCRVVDFVYLSNVNVLLCCSLCFYSVASLMLSLG